MINKTNIIQGLFKEVKKSTKEVVSDLNDIVNNSDTNYPNESEMEDWLHQNNVDGSHSVAEIFDKELQKNLDSNNIAIMDYDITPDVEGEKARIRHQENIGEAKYVLIRVKALVKQLQTKAGITLTLHLPKKD
tara:strand:+ start:311 stop:709 length:399 start_codon:yes stop_codon:yes gene_type:complete